MNDPEFVEFYRLSSPKQIRWLCAKFPEVDHQDIEDAVDAAMLAAAAHWEKIKNRDGWVATSARRAVLEHLRRQRPLGPLADVDMESTDNVRHVDFRLDLTSAVERLSPRQRAVVALKRRDIPDAEIADILDMREGTVRSTFDAAKKRLRPLLDGYGEWREIVEEDR